MEIWDKHWEKFEVVSLVNEIKRKKSQTIQAYTRLMEMKFLKSFIVNKRCERVCDFGSGMGVANIVWKGEVSCTLVDISDCALKKAKEFHRMFDSSKVNFVKGDILESFPRFKGKFDLVWNQGVLEHFTLRDQIRILSKMAEMTKSGGHIVLMVPNKFSSYNLGIKFFEFLKIFGHEGWQNGYEKPMSIKELRKLVLCEGSFRIISVKGIVPFVNALPFKSIFLNQVLINLAKVFENTMLADWFGREIIISAQRVE